MDRYRDVMRGAVLGIDCDRVGQALTDTKLVDGRAARCYLPADRGPVAGAGHVVPFAIRKQLQIAVLAVIGKDATAAIKARLPRVRIDDGQLAIGIDRRRSQSADARRMLVR